MTDANRNDARLAHPAPDDSHNPQMWLWSAERLLYAGQVLWDIAKDWWPPRDHASRHPAAPAQFGTAFLLFGYAFENLIKGLVAQRLASERKPARNQKGELVGIPTTGHKLKELADQRAGLRLQPHENDLLERLSEYVYWAGRYPFMKDVSGFKPGQILPKTLMRPDTDRPLVDGLFEKIAANYEQKYRRLSELG